MWLDLPAAPLYLSCSSYLYHYRYLKLFYNPIFLPLIYFFCCRYFFFYLINIAALLLQVPPGSHSPHSLSSHSLSPHSLSPIHSLPIHSPLIHSLPFTLFPFTLSPFTLNWCNLLYIYYALIDCQPVFFLVYWSYPIKVKTALLIPNN